MNTEATIVARLTAEIPSAIATIAVQGPLAVSLVLQFVRIRANTLHPARIHYGLWPLSTDTHRSEQVVICRTADNTVEIHCHGGQAICQAILENLISQGCQLVTAEKWADLQWASTRSGNGSLERAAELDLLQTQSPRAAAVLLDQFNGALRTEIEFLIQHLPEDHQGQVIPRLSQLVARSRLGLRLKTPWKIVLAGPPNVGKSSLSNAIAGQTRAIVHHEPGTTRDWLQTLATVDGWPIALTDTAGIRQTANLIEAEGVSRARAQVIEADWVLLVIDGQEGWTATHTEIDELLTQHRIPRLIVWNKADVADGPPTEILKTAAVVATSTVGSPGVEELIVRLGQALVPEVPAAGSAVPFRPEHIQLISTAHQALTSGRPLEALEALKQILR